MQLDREDQKPKTAINVFAFVLTYLLIGSAYVVVSDYMITRWSATRDVQFVQSYKGVGFVAITALLLYGILTIYRIRLSRVVSESQQTNFALIAALDRYPGPAAIFGENRKLNFANRYLQNMVGWTDEPDNEPPDEEALSRLPEQFWKYLDQTFSTGEPAGGELVVPNGEMEKYFVASFVPTSSATNTVQKVVALAYDISDRKHSAIRMDIQRRELRQIIDLIPNFVFAKDAEGRYIMANEAFARFHGYAPLEIIGKTVEAILPDQNASTDISTQDQEVMERGVTVFRSCQQVVGFAGEARMFQVTKIPFRAASDNRTAVLGVAIDITDQLQHEQDINKSRERFHALVEHSLDALFVYDRSGTIALVNERACELLGTRSDELLGKDLAEVLVGEESWSASRARPPLFDPGTSFQMVIGTTPSVAKPVEIRVGTLPGEDDGAYLAEIRDISERVRTEREGIILSRLGVDLSAARDASEIGRALLGAIRSYLPVDAFFFAVRVSGKSRFRQKVLADTIDGELKFFPEHDFEILADAPNSHYYGGKPKLLLRRPDATLDQGFRPFGNTRHMSKSLMFIPVKVNEQILALMSVQSYQYDAYIQENLDLLERMANMTAPALESAQASRRAEIFARLGRQLGAARTAEQVAEHVAAMADELVGWDCCIVALYSKDENSITYIYLADHVDGERKRLNDPYPFKKPQLFAERVLKEGPFLVLRDKAHVIGEFVSLGKSSRPALSMIWVPIPGEGGSIGFINLQSYTRDAYDDKDLNSICALADHCGAAIDRTASQELLRYREERYRRAIESIGAAAYQVDYHTHSYIFMGQQIEAMTGYPADAFSRALWEKITLEMQVDPACEYTIDEEGHKLYKQWKAELRIRRRDGSEVWLSDQAVQLKNAAGKPIGTLGILRDITEQKRFEIALRTSEERYALSARGANDGLWDWNLQTNKIHFSERWGEMLGLPPDEMFDDPEHWFEMIHPEDLPTMKSLLEDHLAGRTQHFECEVRTMHQKEIYRWMLIRGIAVRDSSGKATRIAGSQTDITDRVRTQERLLHDALHDPLTGLPNRALLMDHLGRCLENMKRRGGFNFALVFMDLDRFKTINDSLGHLTGDHVLITTAQRLKRSIRPMDVVARFAGDEFALVLENVDSIEEVFEIVSRAQAIVAEPINVELHEIITTSSAGVAMGSIEYESASDILRDADNALYKAKADGAGRCRMFDSSMHEQAVKTLHLEADLRRVIERQQLRLHFQPLINLKSGEIDRFEALLRWQHPDRGMILPDQFMPIAEETGLIFALDEWVIGEACRCWKRWQSMLNGDDVAGSEIRINLNLSPRHFGRHMNLAERFGDIIHAEGLHPEVFGLELTENAILTFRNETTIALNELKQAGFALYLDDFGKGYSSLSYLHSFPFDMVKIDRQFIMRMQDAGPEREIVQAILALTEKLNLGVVAEGVETLGQLEIVKRLGCEAAQGYFISKPVPPNKALDLLQSKVRW